MKKTVCIVAAVNGALAVVVLLVSLEINYNKDVCKSCGAIRRRTVLGLGLPFTDTLVLRFSQKETVQKSPYSEFLGECTGGPHDWIHAIYESAPLVHNLWSFHGKGIPGLGIYPVPPAEGLLPCLQEYEKQDPDLKKEIRAYFADPFSKKSQMFGYRLCEFCLNDDGSIKKIK